MEAVGTTIILSYIMREKKIETSFDDVGTELGKVMTFSELTKLFYLI